MKRMGALLSLTLLLGCASHGRSSLQWALEDDLREAQALIRRGEGREAIRELTLLLDIEPNHREARLLRAIAHQGMEHYADAIQDYETVLKHEPNMAKAHYNLGMIFAFKTNERRRALNHLDQFLSLQPSHSEAAEIADLMKELDPVEALPGSPDDATSPVPLYRVAKSHEEAGRLEEAIQAYRAALKLRPTCAPCLEALGQLLIRNKNVREGELHLKKARLFDSNEPHVPRT